MVAFGQLSPDLDKDFAPDLIIERIRIQPLMEKPDPGMIFSTPESYIGTKANTYMQIQLTGLLSSRIQRVSKLSTFLFYIRAQYIIILNVEFPPKNTQTFVQLYIMYVIIYVCANYGNIKSDADSQV